MIHDVAVLGGGVAGAAAALRLSQRGLCPVWISGRVQDGFKPGEHLSAAALPILKTLGSDAILRSELHRNAHSTFSAWGSDLLIERNAIVQLEGPPIVLDRMAFEQALTDQAVMAGAHRIESWAVDLAIKDNCWHVDCEDSIQKAQFIFDATGRKAMVASKFATRFQADKLGCQYGLYTSATNAVPRPVTLIEAEERGWWYLSVLTDGQAVVNFYTDTDLPGFATKAFGSEVRKTHAIGAYLSDHGSQSYTSPKRVNCNSSWIAPAIGEGWVAIGDAAAAFDPLSSHGMTTALWSAVTAADAFVARDAQKMQSYADSVAQGVQAYLASRAQVYARETRWRRSPFWSRRLSDAATQRKATQST